MNDSPGCVCCVLRVCVCVCVYSFPGDLAVKTICLQGRRGRRCGFDPWVGKIPCRRAWRPTPLFLPRESHGQRSLKGYSPWGCKELDMTEHTHTHTHTHTVCTYIYIYTFLLSTHQWTLELFPSIVIILFSAHCFPLGFLYVNLYFFTFGRRGSPLLCVGSV